MRYKENPNPSNLEAAELFGLYSTIEKLPFLADDEVDRAMGDICSELAGFTLQVFPTSSSAVEVGLMLSRGQIRAKVSDARASTVRGIFMDYERTSRGEGLLLLRPPTRRLPRHGLFMGVHVNDPDGIMTTRIYGS